MKKKPVLSIFADGVRFDSLTFMPFLSSLYAVPLETVLGYSITCHPSMYTGVYPDKHKIAFHWVRGKKNSPFGRLGLNTIHYIKHLLESLKPAQCLHPMLLLKPGN